MLTAGGDIPDVGKVDLTWIQTPLPMIKLDAAGKIIKAEDTEMAEGDAMATTSSPARGGPNHIGGLEQHSTGNLDYDVADENDWDEIQ